VSRVTRGVYTWSDLQAYWECPRAWSYYRMGYSLPEKTKDAMLRGLLVHEEVSNYYRRLMKKPERHEYTAEPKITESAHDLSVRYIDKYGGMVTPFSIDELVVGEVFADGLNGVPGGHPDIVGMTKHGLTVVELKTTNYPDPAFLDHTGQADFYAFLWSMRQDRKSDVQPEMICIDVVSPDYITRVERPPRYDQAAGFWLALVELCGAGIKEARGNPHYGWRCHSCEFKVACRALDATGSDSKTLDGKYTWQEPKDGP
jgi:CRISPR/Cas system-associated exonuclease Cas4 (RecB family)